MGYKYSIMFKKSQSFKKINIINNLIEAQIIESILIEREIPFRIRSFHDTAYDGLFQFQKGWGELYAPIEQKDEILEILESIRLNNK
jgi:hypothetical protein